MLVSAAEPPLLRALGTVSPLCEQWGADFLTPCSAGWVATQRKEVSDYVASKRSSDRIAREVSQMAESPADVNLLLIEGHTSRFGDQFDRLGTFSRYEFLGDMLEWQQRGVWVVNTLDMEETAEFLTRLPVWMDGRQSLLRAPKPRGVTTIERALMALPKVSLGRARKLVEVFPRPLAFTMTREEMLTVDGFGPKTVDAMRSGLEEK